MASQACLRLLTSGSAGLDEMRRLIQQAAHSIQLQTYIFRDDRTGRDIRDQLIRAARRGVRVRVLIDAVGSFALDPDFFAALEEVGGKFRVFNPLHLQRFSYRNHRKLLVCDRQQAVIGGFNLGDEYAGDGIEQGWLDLGLALRGDMVDALAAAFDRLYAMANHPRWVFPRWRSATERRVIDSEHLRLLLSGPGRGANPLKAELLRELGRAVDIAIISPYFLPPWSLRRRLMKRARQGARVRLLLPGKSDVALAWHASRSIYPRLLRAGVEILEYQPQVLHGKLILADQRLYIGSANFNTRSLHIDYELMLRIENQHLMSEARAFFDQHAALAERIDAQRLRRETGWWTRLQQKISYFLMARLDPLVARWLWQRRGQHLD